MDGGAIANADDMIYDMMTELLRAEWGFCVKVAYISMRCGPQSNFFVGAMPPRSLWHPFFHGLFLQFRNQYCIS